MSEGTSTGENLKWMYEGKNSTIDHEQYLLGKRITSLQDEQEDKGDFFLKQQSSIATGNVTILEKLDYESKVREDPLFKIRKNDFEHRKELLSNPLKKKRIKKMLQRALEKDLKRSVQARKRKDSSSSSSGSSSSEDDIKQKLKDKKLRKLLKSKLEKELQNHESDSSEDEPRNKRRSHSSERRDQQSRHGNKEIQHHRKKPNKERRKNSDDDRKRHHREKEKKFPEAPVERREGYGLVHIKDKEYSNMPSKKRRERRTPTPEPEKPRYVRKERPGFSRKLTQKELEAKRQEMMSNAQWRDDQRKTNVKKFTKEEQQELEREEKIQKIKERAEKKGGKAKDFLHDMKLHTASAGSLEDTVRRKKHKLERSRRM